MDHAAAGKVAAELVHGQPRQQFLNVLPQLDDWIRAADPLLICGGNIDGRSVKSMTPLDGGAGQVRVAGRDDGDTAQSTDRGQAGVVDESRRFPQKVAMSGLEEQAPLADAEAGSGFHGVEPRHHFRHIDAKASGSEFLACSPALSTRRDVLTLIGADFAQRRRF